jgi:hypothetical protein
MPAISLTAIFQVPRLFFNPPSPAVCEDEGVWIRAEILLHILQSRSGRRHSASPWQMLPIGPTEGRLPVRFPPHEPRQIADTNPVSIKPPLLPEIGTVHFREEAEMLP